MKLMILVALLCSALAQAEPTLRGRLDREPSGALYLYLEATETKQLKLRTPIDPRLVQQQDSTHIRVEIPADQPWWPAMLFQLDKDYRLSPELDIQALTNKPELGGPTR